MARVCTVCAHPDAVAINEEIVLTRRGNRSIAKRYGVDDSAVQRHKDHIPQLLVKARDDFEAFEAEAILQSIEDLQRETLTVLEEAKDGDKPDHKTILAAIREQRGNLELVAKIKQLIDKAPTINNLIYDSAFISVQSDLLTALKRHPEALADVLEILDAEGDAEGVYDGG